ncbi:MAG: hypothetical protein ACR2LN_02740 [Candidatus Levyibacteriota bacterium]
MATFVVSSPFRNPLTSIQFSFDLSWISLQNPLSFLTLCGGLIVYGYDVMMNSFMTAGSILIYALRTAASVLTQSVQLLNLQPLLVLMNQAFSSSVTYIASIFIFGFQSVVDSIAITSHAMQVAILNTGSGLFRFFHGVSMIAMSIWKSVSWGVVMLTKTLTFVFANIYHFFVSVIQDILSWCWSILIAFTIWVKYIIDTVITMIEWPFKVIVTFLLKYKPFIDIFDKYTGKAFADMAFCFANFGKTMSSLGTNK